MGPVADDSYSQIMDLSRKGCCETWPKPCTYHEGYADGLEAGLEFGSGNWELVQDEPGLRRYRRRT